MTTKIPVELSSTPGIVDNSNATAITIDSSENIGIGTSSPASNQGFGKTVEISDAGATTGPDLMLTNPTAGTDEFLGQLSFNHANDALAAINAKTDGATDSGHIQFQTQKASGDIAERLRISGNNLHLNGGTDARIQLGSGGAGANQVSNNTVHIRGDGTSMKLMAASGGEYLFEINGTEVLNIENDGNVTTGGANISVLTGTATITLADDSTYSMNSSGTGGAALVAVYESGSGDNALFHVGYNGVAVMNSHNNVYGFANNDTDGKICIIGSGHSLTFKNRSGVTRTFYISVYGGGNTSWNL